jgi:hypothetical protein
MSSHTQTIPRRTRGPSNDTRAWLDVGTFGLWVPPRPCPILVVIITTRVPVRDTHDPA